MDWGARLLVLPPWLFLADLGGSHSSECMGVVCFCANSVQPTSVGSVCNICSHASGMFVTRSLIHVECGSMVSFMGFAPLASMVISASVAEAVIFPGADASAAFMVFLFMAFMAFIAMAILAFIAEAGTFRGAEAFAAFPVVRFMAFMAVFAIVFEVAWLGDRRLGWFSNGVDEFQMPTDRVGWNFLRILYSRQSRHLDTPDCSRMHV